MKTGKSHIEYVLTSPEIAVTIQKKGYQSFDQSIYTDHQGMSLDLNTIQLFGTEHVQLVRDGNRRICTKDPKCVSKYINAAHKHLSNNNFWSLLSKLENSTTSDHPLAERLDILFIQAYLHAEQKCICHKFEWWSLPLIQARSTVHILKVHFTKIQCDAIVESSVTKYGVTVECPTDIQETKLKLKKAQQCVREVITKSAEK